MDHAIAGRIGGWTGGDTPKLMLADNTYTPAQDTDDYIADVEGDEITGTNYTAGGGTITNVAASYSGGTNTLTLDANDLTFTAIDPTTAFRYGAYYFDTAGASTTDPLVCWLDFGADQDPGGNDFTIQWHANGVITMALA